MTSDKTTLRLAIAQPAMYWTTAENTRRIIRSLQVAADDGAQLCLFPELALTGFHRGIREQAEPVLAAAALQRVQETSRALGIACAVGAPTYREDGAILNSYLLIDDAGRIVAETPKDGLTPAEATFFQRGASRPVVQFEGRRCATVICREVEDAAAIDAQLAPHQLDLVFWPGLVSPMAGAADPLAYGTEVTSMARRLGAYIVQSNWPQALNTPDASRLGLSRVVDPEGRMLLQLPADEAGVGVFDLGERDYRWTPMPA